MYRRNPTRIRLLVEHLPDQVVDDPAIASRESGDQLIWIATVAQRQRRQIQPRGPALGAMMKAADCLDRQTELVNFVQQVLRSGSEKPSCSGSISLRLPRARNLASGSGGSDREAITKR